MMNRKWTALLCCMALMIPSMGPFRISQGAAGKQSQKQAKDVTKTSRKTSKALRADGAEQDNPLSGIPSKKEQELIENTDFSLSDVPEELLENANVKSEEVKDIDGVDNLDLHSFTTVNKDQSKTLHVFESPVKYYDKEENEIKFIDNDFMQSNEIISGNDSYAYENKDNAIKVYLPENSREYVTIMNQEESSLSFSPMGEKEVPVRKKTVKFLGEEEKVAEYGDAFGQGYDLQYIPQSEGVKENILIHENKGKYEFSFHVKAPGLMPDQREGQQISFLDEGGEVVYTLGKLFIRDSYVGEPDDADHLSFENTYRIQQADRDCYILTYVLDQKFLESETTQYPVLVDPSITPNKDIYDAPIYSKKPSQNFGGNAYAEIGKVSDNYGVGFGYFQTKSMHRYIYINPRNITRAALRVYEGSGTTYSSKILAYDTADTWGSSTITWNNRPGKSGGALSSHTMKKSGYYEFAITSCAKSWLSDILGEGGFSQRYGITLMPDSNTQGRKDICTTNHGTASKRPCIKIDYTEDTSIGDGTYYLQNLHSDLHLAVNDQNSNVIQQTAAHTMKQQWTVRGLANGYYCLANRYYGGTGYLRTVKSSDGSMNANIWAGGTGDPIRYKIVKNNDSTGTYRILSKISQDLDALSIAGGSKASGADARFSSYTREEKKKWRLKKVPAAQLLPDMQIRGMKHYTVSTVAANPFTVSIFSSCGNALATDTLFQMYDSNGTLAYAKYVSTPAFKGETPSTVRLDWQPQKAGSYTMKVTLDARNVCNESNESNNTYSKTVNVIKGYRMQVKNYYDEGFLTRYGSSGVTRMKEATRAVQEFYRDAFGLWLTIPEPIQITSQMDICKKCCYHGLTKSSIEKPCLHGADDHTEQDKVTADFRYKYSTGNTAANKLIVMWTGHDTHRDKSKIHNNRSFTYPSYHVIMMLDTPSENDFRDRMTYIYEHEIAHNLNAPDHYCYEDYENGKCKNKNCVICYLPHLKTKYKNCLMLEQVKYFFSYNKTNWNTIFCLDCKADINAYMQKWCMP